MKLPLAWMLEYLPADLRGKEFAAALNKACLRWDLEPAPRNRETLGKLLTFAGFNCDAIHGDGPDIVLELDVLSNRPDCQCILGLAREVAAILRVPLRVPSFELSGLESGEPASSLAGVRVDDAEMCPRYTARIIRGVKVGPSPEWLSDRIQSMGLQPRNNIVDVTNFVLFELNQPLHAFDLNELNGRQIIVRRASEKEIFEPLYGEVPALTPETLVIADAQKPRAIAGILGGKGSEVTANTTDILLESAYFNPANTRRTVRRLKVMDGRGTDSSYRFERGVDQEAVHLASARAARLIVETGGGHIAPGLIDCWPKKPVPKSLTMRMSEVKRVFGAEIPRTEAEKILVSIGCQVQCQTDTCATVIVPSWRRGDLEREIDLIEEVSRLHGFNFVLETTTMSARVAPRSARERVSNSLRDYFTAKGYFEAITDSLIDPDWAAPAIWTKSPPLPLDKSSVLRGDHSALRNSVLASLLSVRKHNQDQRAGEVRLFEIGTIFLTSGTSHPEEKRVFGMIDDRGFHALAQALNGIGPALELDGAHLKLSRPLTATPDFLHPAESARIMRVRELHGHERAEDCIGWVGTISASLQKSFGLRRPLAVCELDLMALANLPSSPRRYRALPAFPEITRDVALVVDEAVAWSDIEEFARAWQAHDALRDPHEAPHFLSIFRGKQMGEGKKSLAFSITYRAPDKTLTDDEVNIAHQKFQTALLAKFNAVLRA